MSDRPPEQFNHLTLTTGHLRVSPRAEVSDDVIAQLRPLVAAEGGEIPAMPGWYLDFVFPLTQEGERQPGAAYFQIAREPGMGETPAIMAIAAWEPAAADKAWFMATMSYRPFQALGGKPALAQPKLPWLAVWLTPFALDAPPEKLAAFGDLERCVFWTLVETHP